MAVLVSRLTTSKLMFIYDIKVCSGIPSNLCRVSTVNAFTIKWNKDNNWLVPPISEISNVIKQMLFQNASGVLVIPKWESAKFWVQLVNFDGSDIFSLKGVIY